MDAPAHEEGQTTEAGTQLTELSANPEEEGAVPGNEEKAEHVEEPVTVSTAAEAQAELPAEENASPYSSNAVAEEVIAASAANEQPNLPEGDAPEFFSPQAEEQMSLAEAVRPFTDFIEEFRQTEAQFGSLLSEPESSFTAFVAGSESIHEPVVFLETAPEDLIQVVDSASLHLDAPVEQTTTGDEVSPAPLSQSEEASSGLTQPRLSPERPVSPLLRPATRPRVPRHGRHRIDELIHPAELRGDVLKAPVPTPEPVEEPVSASEAPTPVEQPKPEEQPTRPARRYRFDRPAATASAAPAAASKSSPPAAPARATESKEKRGFATPAEAVVSAEPTPARAGTSSSAVVETPVARVNTQETTVANLETPAPVAPVASATERRRRGNHERTREKEQAAAAPIVAPVPEPVAPVVEPAPVVAQDVPLEDLPPLEYSELQAANSRRRRRRRPGSASTVAAAPSTNGALAPKTNLSDLVAPPAPSLPVSAPAPAPLPAPMAPRSVPQLPPASYNIVSGYTVSQMNQGNDMSGPFMGPEPSPARGSTFSSTPVRHVRNEALRNTPAAHPVKPSEAPIMSNAAVNHMANVVSQAIQTQTDRMVAELRRANQVPTSVSVSLPPFPSTERVGVFVDVANLLYSARTLRMTVDFGKLLDFLRGNRRLVRAQAYCPTSPQPGDDQMFLQAVKGLGYRITTKNYKTFSSGAKKADLDLDLCMDVVRLVDGGAVDCVVLVSGDSDFMPMLDYCSDHGVRVEVAAFDESMSATLRQACDLFVNLSMLEEIRA